MSTLPPETVEPIAPTEESRLAGELTRSLTVHLGERRDLQVQILNGVRPKGEVLALPDAALQLLTLVLTEVAKGNAVTLMPMHAELTIEQAADFLNVSPPFLIGLLDEGRIPYRMVGTLRRVPFKNLIDYKKKSDERCRQALDELVELSQELNLY